MISLSEVLLIVGVADAVLNGATRLAATVGSRVTSATISKWDCHNEEGLTPNTAHTLHTSGLGSSVVGHAFSRRETYGPLTSASRASLRHELTFDHGQRLFIASTFFRQSSSRVSASGFKALAFIRSKYSRTCERAKSMRPYSGPAASDREGIRPRLKMIRHVARSLKRNPG